MRVVKMVGLAGVGAAMVVASLGTATASASQDTLLCLNNTIVLRPTVEGCSPVKHIHFKSVGHVILLGNINIECNVLLLASTHELLAHAGLPLHFDLNVSLSYSGCLGGCAVTVVSQGTILILKVSADLAEIIASGFNKKATCFGLNCDYSTEGLEGHLTGGVKPHITYSEATIKVTEKLGGFIPCPSAKAFHALLESLTPIYVRS